MLIGLTGTIKGIISRASEELEDTRWFGETFDENGVCSCTWGSNFYLSINAKPKGAKTLANKNCKNCGGEGIAPMSITELRGTLPGEEKFYE